MGKLKSYLYTLGIFGAFVLYSYFNYSSRRNALEKVDEYKKEADMTQIFYLREFQFNIFDWLIEDKTQNSFIFVNKNSVKRDNNNYNLHFSNWKDPKDDESLTNYILDRKDQIFNITICDLKWNPIEKDSISTENIDGKIFKEVDDWIKKEYK